MEWVEIGKSMGLAEGIGPLFLPAIIVIVIMITAVYLYSGRHYR
jgi:hypothetical protein